MYFFENIYFTLLFWLLQIVIISNADNTKSCTYKSYLRITWFDELKELQEFWTLQIWSKNSDFERENSTIHWYASDLKIK